MLQRIAALERNGPHALELDFRAGLAGHGRGGSSGERAATRGAYGLIQEWAQPNRQRAPSYFPCGLCPSGDDIHLVAKDGRLLRCLAR